MKALDIKEKHILYLDDEKENLEGFKFVFRKEYNIHLASSVKEAFEILRTQPIRLVLSDNRMPDMLGIEFFEIIAATYPDINRVLVTAFADTEAALQSINKGKVYYFITKPWNKNELKAVIDNALEAYALKAENNRLIQNLSSKNIELEDLNFKLIVEIAERRKVEEELATYQNHLEKKVAERTEEIAKINIELSRYQLQLENIIKERTSQLQESEERLRTISDNLPGGAIFRGYTKPDDTDYLVFASANIKNITGISANKLLNSIGHFYNRIHPEDIRVLLDARHESLKSLKILDVEIRYINENNDLRWLQLRMMYHRGQNGLTWWDGYVIDITERIRAQIAAREQENVIRKIQEGIAAKTGEELLTGILTKLSETLKADLIFIAQRTNNPEMLEAISINKNGKFKHNVQYKVKNSPCEIVINGMALSYKSGVAMHYPDSYLIAQLNAEGYIGIPLSDSQGHTIGVMAALYSKPVSDLSLAEQMLQIFSSRVGAELERLKFEQEIQLYSDVAFNMQIALNVFQMEDKPGPETFTLIKANPAAANIIKMSSTEMVGKTFDEIYPQLTAYNIQQDLIKVISTGKPYSNEEFRFFSPDGQLIFFTIKAFRVPNNCVGVLFEDITRRKRIEKDIIESQQRYRILFENSPNGIHLIGTKGELSGCITSVNSKVAEMLGYNSKELIGMSPDSVMRDISPQEKLAYTQRLMAGETVVFETYFYRKDNTSFPVEVTANVISILDELYILGIDRDITEITNARKRLQENVQFLTTLIETIPLPFYYKDKEGVYLGCNSVFEEYTGYKRKFIIGKKDKDIYPPHYAEELQKADNKLLKSLKTQKYEGKIPFADASVKDVIFNKALFYNTEGSVIGIIGVMVDITERKNIENKLLETVITTEEKERERFAGNLHDEVGPLLSSLKMYLSLLAETEDKGKKDYIIPQVQTLIKEAIQTVREISNDLSPHILNNYGCIAAIESFIGLKKDFVHINFIQNIESKRFGQNKETIIYRIVKELLNNTIKHASASEVELRLVEDDGIIKLSYSDNGVGFDLNSSLQKQTGSIGLLNIMSRVKTIEGTFKILTSKGKGFSFELTVPI